MLTYRECDSSAFSITLPSSHKILRHAPKPLKGSDQASWASSLLCTPQTPSPDLHRSGRSLAEQLSFRKTGLSHRKIPDKHPGKSRVSQNTG